MSLVECKAGQFEGFFKMTAINFLAYLMQNMNKDGMNQLLLKKN